MTRKLVVFVVLILVALLATAPAAAVDPIPGDCVDVANVADMVVCFLGAADNSNGTTTWTYAVKSNTTVTTSSPTNEPDAIECHPTLKKLKLEVCIDDVEFVTPAAGVDAYTTFSPFGQVTGREGIEYDVGFFEREDTGDAWIYYYNPDDPLGTYPMVETDIFQFTQPTQSNQGYQDGTVWVYWQETGTGDEGRVPGMIQGPVCDSTTAVELTQMSASSGLFARLVGWLGLQ